MKLKIIKMKMEIKKIKLSVISLLLLTVLLLANFSCKKETDCTCVITVKMLNDTTKVVSSAFVKITKYAVGDSGVTNGAGQYETKFENEAILDVEAIKEVQIPITDTTFTTIWLQGVTTVRLLAGEVVNKTVFVE